jgi:lysophospholipase L1-like esterase
MPNSTYLALGDSYTIGEGVPLFNSFPYQAVQLLRQKGLAFAAPEVVALTGWTTDELQDAMQRHHFLRGYDWVSLLIGVNNQYRNRPVADYAADFTALLQTAITLAGGHPHRVMVLSIPDWGVTPFAEAGDAAAIATAIDAYNATNCALAAEKGVHYIDITTGQRQHGSEAEYLAADGLHPSAKEYTRWAAAVAAYIAQQSP